MMTTPRTILKLAAAAVLTAASALVHGALTVTPAEQPYGYAPPLTLSGFDLSTGVKEFQTWFDPTVWRGDVVAYTLSATGQAQTPAVWIASERLKLQDWNTKRRIVTRNGAANVTFRWASLSAAQQTAIGDATKGPKLLNFLRGDRSNEQEFKQLGADGKTVTTLSGTPAGIFRGRASVLGDFIHGKPVYVGAPPANYRFDNYATFKTTNAARAGRVYAGANDGMLHAFDAATGDEVFAYVPSMLVSKLAALGEPSYTHTYYVDGPLAVGDAFLNSAWKTVLVGGLGGGGKGLFALDVTDATAADESAAATKIMWEVTNASTGFGDLGLTYAQPVIAKLSSGKWAAIVGNGYVDATAPSGTRRAVLYVIDLADGTLIKALDTNSGSSTSPNGLSSPTTVDINGDGSVDYVYAGDVEGQMWKFDLRGTNSNSWSSAVLYNAGRPILGAPDVASHPLGGYMVYFATGALFSTADVDPATATQNYAYGIWDGAPSANTELLEQKLTEALYSNGTISKRVRVSEGDPINWNKSGSKLHKGWRTALPPNEHVLGAGFVREGRYHFTSVNAAKKNPVAPHGENWLMELDYLNGATDGNLVFDLSESDGITEADAIGGATANARVSVGIYLGPGLYSQPVLALVNGTASTTLFNTNTLASPGEPQGQPITPTVVGIRGGHFDYDVFNTVAGSTAKHVHMYDDMYNVLGASFTKSSDPDFDLISSLSGSKATSSSEFFVLVSNGDLSPGVNITVGGTTYKAYQFPNKFDGTQPIYNPTSVKKFQFQMPDGVLDAKDWGTGVVRAGLHPTAPECVIYAPYTPGPNKEVHNGALTIWLVKKGAPASAIAMNVVGKPEKGYKVVSDTWLLKKWTVFWHNGELGINTAPCYGEVGWVPYPPVDPAADTYGTYGEPRAQGSEDPSGLPQFTAVSNNVSFVPSSSYNGKRDLSGTYKVATTYADGTVVTIAYTLDKSGDVTKTTVTTTPGTGGGSSGGGTTTPPPQAHTPTKPPQGYNETRKGGKVGRIAWREVIRD